MHPDKQRNLYLIAAEANLVSARVALSRVAAEVQAECLHTVVYQTDMHRSSPRICPKCGLEADSHSTAIGTDHWTAKGFDRECPLNNHEDRLVVIVDNDEFMRRRPGNFQS